MSDYSLYFAVSLELYDLVLGCIAQRVKQLSHMPEGLGLLLTTRVGAFIDSRSQKEVRPRSKAFLLLEEKSKGEPDTITAPSSTVH